MTITSSKPAAVDTASSEGVVARLRHTFDSGRTRSLDWRLEQLTALARMLTEAEEELAEALGLDLRRTTTDAVILDLSPTKSDLKHVIKNFPKWAAPHAVPVTMATRPGKAWYQYEPLGVVFVIAPWNYPVHLALTPLVAALAAGNCVVIKPSEISPATSATLARLLPRYLDPDAVAVVEGGPEVTQGVLEQAPDYCLFTGSPAVGRVVAETAGRNLTPVTLELGGKCPVVVTSSARLDVTARRIAFGKLLNSGQSCVAPDYVLVDQAVRDEFVDTLAATIRTFSENKRVPIVNERHAARLADLLEGAGGKTMLGGHVDVAGRLAEPTIVLDPEPDSAIMQDEIFGPILPVVTVDSLDAAIAHIRRGTRPLASYLFTEDEADEVRLLAEVSSGGTVVNHVMMHLAVPDLPFGGVGMSGSGRYHGRWGFETFSNNRAVLRKKTRPDPKLMYPPRSPFVDRLIRRLA